MKKTVIGLAIVAPLIIGGVVIATPDPDKKVTICHATSSESNPWTRIVVSENAIGGHFDNPGTPLAGHEDDVLLQGEALCPVEAPPEEEPEPPVVPPTPEQPVTPKINNIEETTVDVVTEGK